MTTPELTPDLLLSAYQQGVFPMSETRDSPDVFWVDPRHRGVIPINKFHISSSLRRSILRETFQIGVNTTFADVVRGCANREETWINDTIFELYLELHKAGFAHCVDVWKDGNLVGGVYGVTIGGAFFGESMFSTETNASKTALAYLVDRLKLAGFVLFDTQFITDHLASLGAQEIPRKSYHQQLKEALRLEADFLAPGNLPTAYDLIQRSTQTS